MSRSGPGGLYFSGKMILSSTKPGVFMPQSHRQQQILELIQQQGFATTEQLVEHFRVTPQTIRRDLNELASRNRVRRHHGGAGIDSSTVNTAYQARKIMELDAKERIAAALVEMIP